MPSSRKNEEEPSSRVLGCDYVSIPVESLEEGVEFYRDIIGLQLRFMIPDRWAEFDLGLIALALYPREPDEGQGGEIALQVENLEVAMSRLRNLGVKFPHGPEEFRTPAGQGRLARFRDSSGNKLELVERF